MPAIEVDAGGTATLPLAPSRSRLDLPVKRPLDQRGKVLRRLLLGADLTALLAAFVLKDWAFGSFHPTEPLLLLASLPLWVLLGHAHRLYHLDSHRADYKAADELGPVVQMTTIGSWGILLVQAAIQPDNLAVAQIAAFWALTVILLMAFRSVVRAFARRQDWYLQRALVIGPANEVEAIVRKINRHPEWGIIPMTHLDSPSRRFDRDRDAGLARLARRLQVDRVMLAPALSESRDRAELVCELTELGMHVDLVPSWSDVVGARLDLHEVEGMPLLTVPRSHLRRSSFRLKRALDLVATTGALILLAPLMIVCAIAIKLESPGPVFFRQRRVGRDDRPFEVFKFRSMCADADARKDEVAALNLHGGGNDTGMFKIREDPRVTRVGAFLRRYSLDELPQLFNIVRGDMSLVGPRPLIENEDRQVEGRFRQRLGLTPGLTGLWQAHGRSEIPFDEMVSMDYLYVTNWSLWGDIKLLMRTCSAVMRGRGAY
jgi:exopolysaccharide biosynthesis polyprenyl glycosylphosphotransferase